jgi:hypothetical protein
LWTSANKDIGSEQISQIAEPRITEIANFDFREKPIRRKRRSREHCENQIIFKSTRSSNGSWEYEESTKIYRWQQKKFHSWVEKGTEKEEGGGNGKLQDIVIWDKIWPTFVIWNWLNTHLFGFVNINYYLLPHNGATHIFHWIVSLILQDMYQ